jgi:hypothetical protein
LLLYAAGSASRNTVKSWLTVTKDSTPRSLPPSGNAGPLDFQQAFQVYARPQEAASCHTVVMYVMLAAAKVPEPYYADYYVAVVTILPAFMVAITVLVAFAKRVPTKLQESWWTPFYVIVSFLYLSFPVFAAIGVGAGLLALKYQATNPIYQWITFICFIDVLVCLAIVSVIYLAVSDPAKHIKRKKRLRGTGADSSSRSDAQS